MVESSSALIASRSDGPSKACSTITLAITSAADHAHRPGQRQSDARTGTLRAAIQTQGVYRASAQS